RRKMSYDTFFTMKRLIERSRSVGEVLRWVTQNPGKVSASHYPIALHKLGQLLQQQPGPPMGVLEQPEFHVLCQAIVSGCAKFDNFSIVNCLYAAAALGLPGESPLVRVLEDESRSRLGRFNQKDVSMVFSSVMRLHPSSPHPLWLPRKAENLTPYTMALIAKYVARHRLREPRLLDTIANFLLKRGEQLDSKVIQKLVFPFSRMNYRPSNHGELFPKLEAILEQKAGSSPLATVNILMSMFQLSHFPQTVLHQVFSPGFITNVMSSPYALIVRRYLSLLDAAVELEFREYSGPRLDPRYRVLMFEHALTADEANRKYSYKGLVAEALRQLVGEECYRQDEVLPPGYCTGNSLGCGERLPWGAGGGRSFGTMSSGCFVTAFRVIVPLGRSSLSPPTAERGVPLCLCLLAQSPSRVTEFPSPCPISCRCLFSLLQTSCCGSTAQARCCLCRAFRQLPGYPQPRPPSPCPCAPACSPSPRICRTLPRLPQRRPAAPQAPGRAAGPGGSCRRSAQPRGGLASSPPRTITAG
uniref:Fas activated serine/threonine kinase n=1 Tax=Cyanistes caeruleus TaxID=156563 RepID=A0A8C0UDL2_CYACU